MRKITLALSAVCLTLGLNQSVIAKVSAPAPLNPGVTVAELAQQVPVHWVSVAQIENSLLGREPMAVGFDIDDTVLFSSPGFYRGQKEVARNLIAMHLKRGDSIYFVTGRSQTKTETVTQTLQNDFQIPQAEVNPVIFAGDHPGQNTKTQWLKDKKIKIFYGDSDGDITAAQDVGARGIRLLRASNSSYQPLPKAGAFGEEVIVNSEY